jgi:hypothetical protein
VSDAEKGQFVGHCMMSELLHSIHSLYNCALWIHTFISLEYNMAVPFEKRRASGLAGSPLCGLALWGRRLRYRVGTFLGCLHVRRESGRRRDPSAGLTVETFMPDDVRVDLGC